MVEKRELIALLISMFIMAIVIIFSKSEADIPTILRAIILAIVIVSFVALAKKITASKLDVDLELKIWQWERYGLGTSSKLKKPIPVGLIIPLLFSFLSIGVIKFFGFLQFESRALPTKVVKRFGQRRYSGIMDWDDALIVFYSLMPLLGIAIICKFFTPIFFSELAKYSWIYVVSNLIPISKLDGTRLFFGSIPLFVFTWILTIITWPIIF